MSKRTGNIVALADILDEVDPDVARMTFLLQGIDTAQTIDLDVVTEQSRENPVYYVQYAHARIASIGRKAEIAGVVREPLGEVDLSLLVHEREAELLRALAGYPDAVHEAAEVRAPQSAASRAFRSSRPTSRRSPTIVSSSCCARSRRTPMSSPRPRPCGRRTGSPPGCATSPRSSTGSTAIAG